MTSPLQLEFLAGMCIAVIAPRVPFARLAGIFSIALGGLFLVFVSSRLYPHGPRFIYFGAPAALLVFGVVLLEDVIRLRVIGLMKRLGDASYSLYLSHALVIALMVAVLNWLHLYGLIPRFLVSVFVCFVAGLLIYRWVETPLLRWLRNRTVKAVRDSQKALAIAPERVDRDVRGSPDTLSQPIREA